MQQDSERTVASEIPQDALGITALAHSAGPAHRLAVRETLRVQQECENHLEAMKRGVEMLSRTFGLITPEEAEQLSELCENVATDRDRPEARRRVRELHDGLVLQVRPSPVAVAIAGVAVDSSAATVGEGGERLDEGVAEADVGGAINGAIDGAKYGSWVGQTLLGGVVGAVVGGAVSSASASKSETAN